MVRQKKTMEELDRIDAVEYRKKEKIPVYVVLDNVRSAHNVGSIFRTCDAFRIKKLYLCGITPVPPNAEIHKTALGATESVEWEYVDETSEVLKELKKKNVQIFAVEQAKNSVGIKDIEKPNQDIVLVFGHEVYGVDQRIIDMSDVCIEIPQFGTKHSLNVSVCAGIVLYSVTHLYDIIP